MTKAMIVGAGPAGTVAALALQAVGIEAVIHERRPRATETAGSWFTVTPNGLDALDAVGALHLAQRIGMPSRTNIMLGATGSELGRLTLGRPLADGTTALTMRRSRLARVLADECERRGIEIHYDSPVADLSLTEDGRVSVRAGRGEDVTADLLIGADGVKSRVRSIIDAQAPSGRYVGLTNFGGITTGAHAFLSTSEREPEAWHFIFGRRAFFGHHVTPEGDAVWFVNDPGPALTAQQREMTSLEEWQLRLAGLFEADAGPASRLIRQGRLELAADNTYDLGHVPHWHRGPIIVIGDAAHAPAPSSGQGAAMAMEDGVVLAQSLRDTGTISSAFACFESVRRRRVERIVRAGARSSSAKTPRRLARPATELMMRAVFRYAVTERSTAWMYDHRIDWVATPAAS